MATNGVCQIKSEFIISDYNRLINTETNQIETKSDNATEEPVAKKIKLSKADKKKARGQNKSRPVPYKRDITLELCKEFVDVADGETPKSCSNSNCKNIHDVQEYLKQKPADIGKICYNFNIHGRCPRGLSCRFGSEHIIYESGRNRIDKETFDNYTALGPQTLNTISFDVQLALRKRTYDFSKSERIIKEVDKIRNEIKNAENTEINKKLTKGEKNHEEEKSKIDNKVERIGAITDEDLIKTRDCEKKKIEWHDKLVLSPLTTVGNLPFRRICKEYGADVTCGEMAMCAPLLQGLNQEWALIKRHVSEDIFGVQLCGNNPYLITKTCQVLQENTSLDFIDLNLGCPIDWVYNQGSGSGLLRRERILESVVRSASQLLNIPFTIKTRTGVYADENIAHKLVPKFKDWGASMVTIHGRSREQRYTKMANWEYINECASLGGSMPVFGNGDILSFQDYQYTKENYKNISGITIGRGALIKPWIFTEIKEQKLLDISSQERFDILKKYANYGLEHWGSDTKGVENTRRFMLEWLSFLYRYIPVGILETPPQKINERPPYFRGRDDLETLMASPNCADWIKISEMLLGPVPENFNFLPKHKANSYQ